jgi:hypothetical protein
VKRRHRRRDSLYIFDARRRRGAAVLRLPAGTPPVVLSALCVWLSRVTGRSFDYGAPRDVLVIPAVPSRAALGAGGAS